MTTTFDVLEQLESTQGTNAKRDLLRANQNNFVLRQVFQVTLDPYLNYGVVKYRKQKPQRRKQANEGVMIAFTSLLLGRLADRDLSGNAAREAVEEVMRQANDLEQKWLDRILKRNLRCGASTSIVNDTWPGTIRGFDTALCNTLKVSVRELKPAETRGLGLAEGEIRENRISPANVTARFGGTGFEFLFKQDLPRDARVNPKLDGLRCVALKRSGAVTLYTRNGNEIDSPGTRRIRAALEGAPFDDVMLDGELLAEGLWERSVTAAFADEMGDQDADAIEYNVFDCMPAAEWDAQRSTLPYFLRDAHAAALVAECGARSPIKHVPTRVVNGFRELLEYYVECLDKGFEGVVVKDPRATYQFDRSDAMLKFKPEATYEGAVVGWFKGSRGSKRAESFAGFWVLLPNGVATRCGTGFSDKDKAHFHAEIQKHGVGKFLGHVAEVKGQPPLTKDGKIRFPRFKRWRDARDVDPAVTAAFRAWQAAGAVQPPVDR